MLPVTATVPSVGFTPDPTLQAAQRELQTEWLNNPICLPPCWAGIIPGETGASEAVGILSSLPWIKNVTLIEDKMYGEINWSWNTVQGDGGGGRIFFDVSTPSRKVKSILPNITGYWGSNLLLGDVIKVYGEPTHILLEKQGPLDSIHAQPIPVGYNIEFIWLLQGFSSKSGLGEEAPNLYDSMPLYTLAFFEPSIDGFIAYRGNSGNALVVWQGYQDVRNYNNSQK